MSSKRVLEIFLKDFKLGPRSPLFLFAIAIPLLLTFLIQVVFGDLFDPSPRLAVVDLGDSEITKEVKKLEGIDVTVLDDFDEMKDGVESHDFDAGFVLQENFDQMVRDEQRPELEFFISGESLASERIILSVTMIDLIRKVEGLDSPVEIEVVTFGEELAPMSERLVPLILFYALFVAGVFVKGMSIVEEKEKGTLRAILTTPTKMIEFVLAKGILGFVIAIIITFITLLLNNAIGNQPFALLLTLFVSVIMIIQIGIIFALLSKDVKALYTFVKSVGFVLFMPAVFYIWPDLPQWIAKIFPTYWMIDPIYKIGVEGLGLGDVWFELLIAFLIVLLLVPVVIFLSKRVERSLAM